MKTVKVGTEDGKHTAGTEDVATESTESTESTRRR
jgi:hypothetical protein